MYFYIFVLYVLRPIKNILKIYIKYYLWFSEHMHPVLVLCLMFKHNLLLLQEKFSFYIFSHLSLPLMDRELFMCCC